MSSLNSGICAFCTFINPPESRICSVCKLSLPAIPAIDTSNVKVCPGCSLYNEMFFYKCKVCGTKLVNDAIWVSGFIPERESESGSASGTDLPGCSKWGTESASGSISETKSESELKTELATCSGSGTELDSGTASAQGIKETSTNVCSVCSRIYPECTLIKICRSCTYHNPAKTTKCLMCETNFGSKQNTVLLKVCPFCNHDNSETLPNTDSAVCSVDDAMDTEEDDFSVETMGFEFAEGVSIGNGTPKSIHCTPISTNFESDEDHLTTSFRKRQANAIASTSKAALASTSTATSKIVYRNKDGFVMLETAPQTHKYFDVKTETNSAMFMRAVATNMEILKTSVPSGVWIKCFEDRLDLLSFMIEGPSGTPYENGLFVFDIHLPSDFPFKPPNAHYISFWEYRLNPNLYVEGKVCVSLLGTWYAQRKEEQWQPTSTLLQLIVSIQGLILVEEPYFNEPAFAGQFGTPEGIKESALYNEGVTVGMVDSTTALINNPPPVFKNDIFLHFAKCGATMYERLKTAIRQMENAPPPQRLENLRLAMDSNVYDNAKCKTK